MAETLYGSDFAGFEDLTPRLLVLEGASAEVLSVIQALARRLSTPRGGLWYDPNYGYDIRAFIADTVEASTAENIVESECRKEERVKSAKCTIVVIGGEQWQMSITGKLKTGVVFKLTLSVDRVTVKLMKGV